MGTTAITSGSLPTGTELLELEAQVRSQGTGLAQAELVGCWRLQQVWGKGQAQVNGLSSSLLRSLGACLILTAGATDAELLISNLVQLGALQLRFDGEARLIGKRPLLQFSFARVEVRLNNWVLLQRSLAAMPAKRQPFFALIGRDPAGWLAARGRGGGLALWRSAP
ncbi:MAG: hypothetical protein ACO289_10340 [Prochlorococcaceae cyanobacterium]